MSRVPVFGGNWKMNLDQQEAEAFLQDFINQQFPSSCEVILFPSFTNLHLMQKYLKATTVKYGAQNFYFEEKGAYTGEVSLAMLKSMGCTHVLTGHSERREIFEESDEMVAKKTAAALNAGLTPMVCVGESLEERKKGLTKVKIRSQVERVLQEIPRAQGASLLFAYEPIWAIGTGENASEEDARSGVEVVREAIQEAYGAQLADSIRITYGGSVKPGNIASYMAQEGIDGGLVGGASLKSADFHQLICNGMG